ncbi:hypothetical protein DXC40_17675 [Anaerotruncus colihominis]|uniref:Uncharacterized protein n=1 Tax=Anaerotruncus colihominis TaxID=169435 RepID=A0A3E3ICC4_9FIRM|nr:hypothetical protein DXC40_17675 [Anaerotruncus colihominis]
MGPWDRGGPSLSREARCRGLSAPGGYSRRKAPNSRPGKRSVRRWATRARVARPLIPICRTAR